MKKLLLSILLALLILLAVPLTALAIAQPDELLSVNAVYVYDDLLEEGDAGVFIDYFIDYIASGNPPTGETATEAYMAVFVDIDGATQLKTVAPYTFQDSGYGRGVIWIYFSAAEVTALSIDRADIALYEVWMVGNPTLVWTVDPVPPKTIAGLDYWQPVDSSAATLLALRILQYADILETAWVQDLIFETPLGHRLTIVGESYFTNVIPNLRSIAPSVFSSGEFDPVIEPLDYDTNFGATLTDLIGTATGSPITLAPEYSSGTASFTAASPSVIGIGTEWDDTMVGASIQYTTDAPVWSIVQSVESSNRLTLTLGYAGAGGPADLYTMTNRVDVTGLGTFTVVLTHGTEGTATSDICVVTGSPVTLRAGTNTITTTAPIGNILVAVDLVNTQSGVTGTIEGTGWDMTETANAFGMSRMLFSGIIWILVSILVCWGFYQGTSGGRFGRPATSGKLTLLIFDVCIIGGAIIGFIHILIAVLLFIAFGAMTGYVLFFRHANV